MQDLRFKSLDEKYPGFVEDVIEDFGGTLGKYHVVSIFVLNDWQNNVHPLVCPDNHPVSLFGQISVLEYL